MKKKVLAIFLALALVLTMMPLASFAEEAEGTDGAEAAPVTENYEQEGSDAPAPAETPADDESAAPAGDEEVSAPADEEEASAPEQGDVIVPDEENTEEVVPEGDIPAEETPAEEAPAEEPAGAEEPGQEGPGVPFMEEPEEIVVEPYVENPLIEIPIEEIVLPEVLPEVLPPEVIVAPEGFDVEAEYEYIMGLEEEEAIAYIEGLTDEELAALEAYARILAGLDPYEEEIPDEFEGFTPPVDFTEVAPLMPAQKAPAKKALKALKAAAPESVPLKESEDIETSKTVTDNGNGTYTITLEAYANGAVSTVVSSTPTDIVLVLDQSSSMNSEDGFTSYTFNPYTGGTTNTTLYNNGPFYVLENGTYYSLNVSYRLEYIVLGDVIYTYRWSTHSATSRDQNGSCPNNLIGNLYTRTSTTGSSMTALKQVAQSFIETVQRQAMDKNVDHRIAVIGFGDGSKQDGGSYGNNYYNHTELLSTASPVRYDNIQTRDYVDALVSANDNGKVNDRLYTALNRLYTGHTDVDTYINYGMEMAKGVFDNTKTAGDGRHRVVVVLTDGHPGQGGDWEFYVNLNSSANRALDWADDLKDENVTIYAVGIFDGADASSAGNNGGAFVGNNAKSNYFMQHLSSNNGRVQTPSYYLTAGSIEAMQQIFDEISHQIDTPAITLGTDTVIRDVVTPYFNVPANTSNVKVYTAAAKQDGTFNARQAASGVTASISGQTISVTGFDYSANFVTTTRKNDGTYGKKLIVEFTVTPKDAFWGGNDVPTNVADTSGMYAEGKDLVENFPVPEGVDVPLKTPTIVANDFNVYYGGTLPDEDDFIKSTNVPEDWETAWETAFVEFTLPSVETISNTADGAYPLKVTVKARDGGATGLSVTDNMDITVFKPKFTATAQDVWAGYGAAVDLTTWGIKKLDGDAVQVSSWKHVKDGVTTDSEAVTMVGSEPAITEPAFTFSQVGAADGALSNGSYTTGEMDASFNLTGLTCKIGDVTETYAVPAGDLTVTKAVESEGHDFTIHIAHFDLVVNKTETTGNAPVDAVYSQDHVFDCKDNGYNGAEAQFVINGAGSKKLIGLVCGKSYTLKEEGSWGWRYTPFAPQNVTCPVEIGNSESPVSGLRKIVNADNELNKPYWLGGSSHKNNKANR